MLVNEEALYAIMGRMPETDWKHWAKDRPNWIHGAVEHAFEKSAEQKWKGVLNMARAILQDGAHPFLKKKNHAVSQEGR
jgi:hypothetical protein